MKSWNGWLSYYLVARLPLSCCLGRKYWPQLYLRKWVYPLLADLPRSYHFHCYDVHVETFVPKNYCFYVYVAVTVEHI